VDFHTELKVYSDDEYVKTTYDVETSRAYTP
jgi:hypothetical protein